MGEWMFNGSIYEEVSDAGFTKKKAVPEGKVITRYNGKPAIVQDGRLFVKKGDVPGWGKPNWEAIEKKHKRS